jgi:hypothetical protein
LKSLSRLASEKSADFIITGACDINEQTLNIDLQIFNALSQEYVYITKNSAEVGEYIDFEELD